MSLFRPIALCGAALLISASSAAYADDAPFVIGTSPVEACANAASAAENNPSASLSALATCSDAVRWARMMPQALAEALTNRSVLHLARGEADQALQDSNAALRIRGNMPETLANRGIAEMSLGHPTDAVASFTAALAQSPARPERVYFNRAMAREDLGDLKGAYQDYSKAAQLAPQWSAPQEQLARFTVGRPNMG